MKIYRLAFPSNPRVDWENVDWSKSSRQIGKEHGISRTYVSIMRQKFAPQTIFKPIDWSSIDWSKPTARITEEEGVAAEHVSEMRKKYAPETTFKAFDWPSIDWSKSNHQITQETGVTPTHVSKMRSQLAPETLKGFIGEGANWSDVNWDSERNIDIAVRKRVSPSSVHYMRSSLAPDTLDLERKTPPPIINWESLDYKNKSTKELAQEVIDKVSAENDGVFPFSEHSVRNYVSFYRRRYAPETRRNKV